MVSELERMPDREFREWIAYFGLEPMPDPAWDAGQICATIANSQRAKGQPPFRAQDFMRLPDRGAQSESEMRANLERITG